MRDLINGRSVTIAFPEALASEMLPLLVSEQEELIAVFGAPVIFADTAPESGPRWIVDVNPQRDANELRWDADSLTLTSFVRDAAGLGATLQMLHSLVTRQLDAIRDDEIVHLDAAAQRLRTELTRGFPGYQIRDLDPDQLWHAAIGDGPVTVETLQRYVAMHQDGHTAMRRMVPVYNPPYVIELVEDAGIMRRLPTWSDAWAAGVREGWRIAIDDAHGWRARTGSPPHSLPLVAARRAIALNGIDKRAFTATSPEGERITWTDHARSFTRDELLDEYVVADDTIVVRLHNWIAGVGVEERLTEIIATHAHRQTLVFDLRGNTGGNLLMAKSIRRLFLREETVMGSVRFTRGDGTLSDPMPIVDAPPTHGTWPGKLVVLTDAMTYSASEDFLHGLQGLSHVTVIGQPTGGGSGRPRTLPVIDGWSVSISTALTYDRDGHCIESQGVPVDVNCDPYTETWQHHLGH